MENSTKKKRKERRVYEEYVVNLAEHTCELINLPRIAYWETTSVAEATKKLRISAAGYGIFESYRDDIYYVRVAFNWNRTPGNRGEEVLGYAKDYKNRLSFRYNATKLTPKNIRAYLGNDKFFKLASDVCKFIEETPSILSKAKKRLPAEKYRDNGGPSDWWYDYKADMDKQGVTMDDILNKAEAYAKKYGCSNESFDALTVMFLDYEPIYGVSGISSCIREDVSSCRNKAQLIADLEERGYDVSDLA